jgi:predicted transcriptional regulator
MRIISPFDVSPKFHELFHKIGDVRVVALSRRVVRSHRFTLMQEELQKVKEEFSAALAEVQQELQTLAERPLPEPYLDSAAA